MQGFWLHLLSRQLWRLRLLVRPPRKKRCSYEPDKWTRPALEVPGLWAGGKSENSAFIDLGDQFLALQRRRRQPADDGRHFGLVVDDKDRKALVASGVQLLPGPFGFPRPMGQSHRDCRLLQYPVHQIPFTKAHNVLRGMGLAKNDTAIKELTEKGMAPN
jgi:lactoylglutathione lyase